jgi:hypothetical protein
MTGGTLERIQRNLPIAIGRRPLASGCQFFTVDLKIRSPRFCPRAGDDTPRSGSRRLR